MQFSTSAALTSGIIGGYAVYDGTDFAALGASGSGFYAVQVCSNYTAGNLGVLGTSATTNAELSHAKQRHQRQGRQLAQSHRFDRRHDERHGLAHAGVRGLIGNTTGTISGGTLQSSGGELNVTTPQSLSIASVIANSGSATALVKTGTALLTLSGQNTFSGNTYINQGGIAYIPPASATYSGAISGPGYLVKSGTATLTLCGNSSYSGRPRSPPAICASMARCPPPRA